jgi:hypothetical protein
MEGCTFTTPDVLVTPVQGTIHSASPCYTANKTRIHLVVNGYSNNDDNNKPSDDNKLNDMNVLIL